MSTPPPPQSDPPPQLPSGDTESWRRGSDAGRLLPALILIGLGILFFAGNFVPIDGSLLFLGLGLAFFIGRIITRNYGLAVPAGILLGFGSYVALDDANLLPTSDDGWFFVLLGLGFLAVYLIGLRPTAVWPLFPAAILSVFGLILLGVVDLSRLAQFAWLVVYWPLILVVVGLWLLVRDRLPRRLRQPLAAVGVMALILYGALAVSATVAAGARPIGADLGRVQIGLPLSGTPPSMETIDLAAPIAPGETLRVVNTSGFTSIQPGSGDEVRVVATKHFWSSDQQPDVRLTPVDGVLTLEATPSNRSLFGSAPYVDYAIEVPANAAVNTNSTSGDIEIVGLATAVQANASSGKIRLTDLSGSVTARTSSGDVVLTNVSGELRINTSSGDVEGSSITAARDHYEQR